MQAVFTRAAIQEIERKAEQAGISLGSLMENAGAALAQQVREMLAHGGNVAILCGSGNNGGDGFVCARRLLEDEKYTVSVILCGEPKTDLGKQALAQLPKRAVRLSGEQDKAQAFRCMAQADLLLDAVFGFSFHGEIKGVAKEMLDFANWQGCKKLAADLPSGVVCDTGAVSGLGAASGADSAQDTGSACDMDSMSGTAFRADVTVTFHGLKPACVSYPGKEFCGETVVCAVGVPPEIIEEAPSKLFVPQPEDIRQLLPQPHVQSNKGSRGRLLLVCGSYGMAGACVLAARSALRSGVGLLDIFTSAELYPILAPQLTEAIFTIVPDFAAPQTETALAEALSKATACVMGCGLGKDAERLCPIVLQECKIPLLIDADGLNFLARHPEIKKLPAETLLTPHPGELSRLMKMPVAEIQASRLEITRKAAAQLGAVLLLKGAGTVIAEPAGTAAVNPTGNPGMAKGGSGDTLSGIIGALLSQKIPVFQAAFAGAYLHGMAGDKSAAALSMRAALPTDFIDRLPEVFQWLESM